MVQNLKYNPEADMAEVDQFGFVDINKAFANGYIPGSNVSTTLEFDDASDPSAIMGKPSDVFEAMRMQDSLMEGLKSIKTSTYSKDVTSGSSYNQDEN